MLDETELSLETALLLRPLPRSMWNGDEPMRFGGKPRLPQDVAWPRDETGHPLHFIVEIDLSRLPRDAAGYPTPDLLAQGSLFLFLPLDFDRLYSEKPGRLVFTPDDVSTLPECDPPSDLGDIGTMDPNHVHEDGTTEDGRLLVRQKAEVLQFRSERAINRLAEPDGGAWKRANQRHQAAVLQALKEARTFPGDDPEKLAPFLKIPLSFRQYLHRLRARHLDWEFIFDWSKDFFERCQHETLGHLYDMQKAGVQPKRVAWAIRSIQKTLDKVGGARFAQGRKPNFYNFFAPVSVARAFDWQARRWMALSRFRTGALSPETLDLFVDMLIEIDRRANQKDEAGEPLGLRAGLLYYRVKGHGLRSDWTRTMARNALRHACDRAVTREPQQAEGVSKDELWDRRIVEAQNQLVGSKASREVMPFQMFGLGYDYGSLHPKRDDDVLLFQFGEGFGLPLETGQDPVLQIWIKRDDLAAGRFDRVDYTLDMS
ncbi:MAG: DUF1963 domain-containing protein [Dinoroseobacter sp.]|nr:DUF1963 domain-containing protein [Dinoroseobacter sp.]